MPKTSNWFTRMLGVIGLALKPFPEIDEMGQRIGALLVIFVPWAIPWLTDHKFSYRASLLSSVSLFAVALLIAGVKIQKKLDDAIEGAPRLVATGVNTKPNVVLFNHGKMTGVATFYHIKIANRPTGTITRPTAKKVGGRVQIFNLSGKALGHERLQRWEHSPQTAGTAGNMLIPEDLLPSGVDYMLDIAMKVDAEEDFYLTNNDTASAFVNLKDPDNKFGPGEYVAKINLIGENVDTWLECTIHNLGAGKRLRLEIKQP